MTGRLYLIDPYKTEFEADIVESLPHLQGFSVILQESYFHPEGGGQPSDRGTLNGQPILDLQLKGDQVIHVVAASLSGRVSGKIDWGTRFDFMQQHTGQHILSQAALRLLNAPTVGFRLTSPTPSIEIVSPALDERDIAAVEDLTNQIIREDHKIRSYFVSDMAVLASLPLRNKPPQKGIGPEGVRIVEIPEFECVPCGGTHCTRTGEVGLVMVKDWSRKDETWHIDFVCGGRALNDYREKRSLLRSLRQLNNVPEGQVVIKTEETLREVDGLRRSLEQAQNDLLDYETAEMHNQAVPALGGRGRLVAKIYTTGDVKRLRAVAAKLVSTPNMVVALAQIEAKSTLIVARSDNLDVDAAAIIQKICAASPPGCTGRDGVRGGGNPKIAQVGGLDADRVAEMVQLACSELA
jgi:alanyl-tRNA synthetase